MILLFQFSSLNTSAQYSKLLDFAGGTEARDPIGVLITDGIYMYGISFNGGTSDMGTIYKIKQDGTGYLKIHDFTGTNGKNPEGSLYYDGTFLYGMTYYGGTNDMGVIYKIMPDGSSYQKLLDFDGTNGRGPYGTFVSDGTYLYGMTWEGGTNNLGRIFKILPDGSGYQSLMDFNGASNGSLPAATLYFDGSRLFGMTSAGGANGVGTVFGINTNGAGYTKLHDFAAGTNGREPYGTLISDGTYLYGMTYFGGANDLGTAFRIMPDGTNFTKLIDFTGGAFGSHPYTTLTLSGSYLYGLTPEGGSNNLGILFKVKPDGTGLLRLQSFVGTSNGSSPTGSLLSIGPYLYGTTSAGGASGNGTMFKYEVYEPLTKLLDFTGPINGLLPYGSLYSDGTFLYGMTEEGGVNNLGTIFKVKPDGTEYSKLLDFAGATNGSGPFGSLISDGIFLYGMTYSGGTSNVGTIFKIMPDGTGYMKLHEFNALANGVYPESDLYYVGGWLYGMTPSGGANNRGTFFKIMPDGTGYQKLSDFGAPFDGSGPRSSLYYDGTFFYGTTNGGGSAGSGTIFKIKPDGTNLTKVWNFGIGTDGRSPGGSFTTDGTYLYGTTEQGGANNYGSLFKIKPDGTDFSTILSFDNNIYGSSPQGTPLLVGEFLYTLAYVGGPNFEGTVFKIKTDGTNFSVVHEFSGLTTGNYPLGCSLITDGTYFYGMTNSGGLGEGTLFRFRDIPENTTLFNFTGIATGSEPTYNRLTCDGSSLYGMTSNGGTNDDGVVFKINTDGKSFTKLYDFGPAPDGEVPFGSLYKDGTSLYGTTILGGTSGDGIIFKIQSDGTGYQKIFDFNGVTTGTDPGSLISDGTFLYGLARKGGLNNSGTIFKVLSDGTGFLKLYDFALGGGLPWGDLILIGTTLFGTTAEGGAADNGTIFKIETNGAGFTSLHEFDYPDGVLPYTGALVYDGTFLYGMTEIGGAFDDGIVFKIKPDGTGYGILHSFQLPTAGIPLGALELVGSKLYGLTIAGGPDDLGTLFGINTDGTGYQTLMNFDGIANGYDALGTLCYCGNALYGMTTGGGPDDLGTIFKFVPAIAAPGIPTITSFSPLSGPVSTTVTITGTNFDATPSNNILFFGATKAIVSAATSTQLTVTVPVGATYQPISVLVGGLTAYSTNSFIVTFPGAGPLDACAFAASVDFPATASLDHGLAVSDLDGDGKVDIATNSFTGANTINHASIYRNTSIPGEITATSFLSSVNFNTLERPKELAIGDLDGDGKPDIVVAHNNGHAISIYKNISTSGTLDAASFGPRVDFVEPGISFTDVAIADLDLDGKPELIATPNSVNQVFVYRNVSITGSITSASFSSRVNFPVGTVSDDKYLAIADLDNDGKPEIIVTLDDINRMAILKNITTSGAINASSFAPGVEFVTGRGPEEVKIGDIDGDSKPDIVVANWLDNDVSVFRNTTTTGVLDAASFAPEVQFLTGQTPDSMEITDVDGDGKPDLIVPSSSVDLIAVLRNTSTPGAITASSFAGKVDFLMPNSPSKVVMGDFDGDGKPDMAALNYASDVISVLRNTIVPPSIASFAPAAGSIGTTVTISGTNFSGTPSENVVLFNGTAATVTASTMTQIIFTVPVGATTGTISVTVACKTSTSTGSFTVSTLPISPQPVDQTVCSGTTTTFTTTASGTTNITYQWQFSTTLVGTYNHIVNGNGYSNATTSILTVNTTGNFGAGFYRCEINGDLAATAFSNPAQLIVLALPSPPATTGASGCSPTAPLILSASGASNGQYRWYTVSLGGTAINGEVNNTYSTPALSTTTTYYISIHDGTCESTRTPVTATVTGPCNLPPVISSTTITAAVQGTASIPLLPLLSDPDNNLDLSSLKIIAQPTSGAFASIDVSQNLLLDYTGINFSGTDHLTIEICDLSLACAQQELAIEVIGNMIAYNALSPGNDGMNDIFFLQYIDILETTKNNKVTIFDRWGTVVFEVHNYNNTTNVFRGISNSGKDLPTGTYFYKIDFNVRPSLTGYISLKR